MTRLREKEQVGLTAPPTRLNHVLDWTLSILGVIAAGFGGYLYFADPGRTLTVFGRESTVGEIAEGWGFGLLIAGGLLLCAAFAVFARKVFDRDGRWTAPVVTGTICAVAGLAVALAFGILWII